MDDETVRQKIMERIQLVRGIGNKRIPFKGGRPKRTEKINNDDILNLKILLNTANSLEEFLFSS